MRKKLGLVGIGHLVFILLGLFACNLAIGQSINGSGSVSAGEEANYTIDVWLHPYSNVQWNVTGGTILYSDMYNCYVRWDEGYGSGSISFQEDIYGYSAYLAVCYGNPQIEPLFQEISYGLIPSVLQLPWCAFDGVSSFQWEESIDLISWMPVGDGSLSFVPLAVTETKYYRVRVQLSNGNFLFTQPAEVRIPELDAGFLFSGASYGYGQTPVITSIAATGGRCVATNYQYSWEYRNGSGQWVEFATTESISSNTLPPLTFEMSVRRKVVCGNESKFTNTIVLVPNYVSVNWENRHYIREIFILRPGVKSWYEADDVGVVIGEKFQVTSYLDEWGRVVQTNDKLAHTRTVGNSTQRFDFVGIQVFDELDRERKSYLSYPAAVTSTTAGFFRSNALSEQNAVLNSFFEESAGSATWTSQMLEASPLERVLQVKRPGGVLNSSVGYAGATISSGFNAANEVLLWKCSYGDLPTDYPAATSYYDAGTLTKVKTINERGTVTISYSDSKGLLIMQKVQQDPTAATNELGNTGWQITYNVYNDFQQLRFIITPKAFEILAAQSSYNLTTRTAIVDDLCFYYNYDIRGRVYVSHEPGAGINYRLYDLRNRPILVQTQKLRELGLWQFTLYDDLDRAMCTGIAIYSNPVSGQSDIVSLTNSINNLGQANVSVQLFTGVNETVQLFAPAVGSAQSIPGFSNLVVNERIFYDGYDNDAVQFLNAVTFPTNNIPHLRSFAASKRLKSFATGQKVRIIDNDANSSNDVFVRTTQFFDETGTAIQVNKEVFKENVNVIREITSSQMDWMGKASSTVVNYQVPGTSYTNFDLATSYNYDYRQRLVKINKHFGTTSKSIVELVYNEFNKIASKRMAPGWEDPINPAPIRQPANGIENLSYTYNIHGALEAINKGYALQNSTNTDQWSNVFGMYLGYEKGNGLFSAATRDGLIAGMIWRTQGDNVVRKFDYTYDLMSRLTIADFMQREKPTESNWSKSIMDFSVTGLAYDIQGNILAMQQMGLEFGKIGGKQIDNLVYTYMPITGISNATNNKLQKVFDNAPSIGSVLNGTAGDFKDASWGTNGNDYTYDLAGNLTMDANKNLSTGAGAGILYNFLNVAHRINVDATGVIEYVFLANGQKVAKKTTPSVVSATNPAKTTWYIGALVFEEIVSPNATGKQLQYIMHEEGRIRAIPHVAFANSYPTYSQNGGVFSLPDGKFGVFDYFISDHLGNNRFVLTEEKHEQRDFCGMDDANTITKGYEEAQFNFANRANSIRYQKPSGIWTANTDNKVMRLGGPGSTGVAKTGPGVLLKVMAGDRLNMMVNYHFANTGTNTANNSFYTTVASTLANALTGAPGSAKYTAVNGTQGAAGGPIAMFLQNAPVTHADKPRAYMSWLFYDENFNYVPYDAGTGLGSSSMQVNTAGDHMSPLMANGVKVPKNGYVFVYVSNASDEQYVYFDNFQVNHVRGKILEENSYYPYGLRILPISANAMLKPEGKNKYNGIEQIGDFGLQDYDALYRELDPQIGRGGSTTPKLLCWQTEALTKVWVAILYRMLILMAGNLSILIAKEIL